MSREGAPLPRTLSIRATPLLKFVAAPLWVAAAAFAIWLLSAHPDRILSDEGPGLVGRWLLLVLLLLSVVVAWAFVIPLKRVRLQADGLRVSNYAREHAIPFSDLADVRQNWLPTFRLVTIELRGGGRPFGGRILFMPAVPRLRTPWRPEYWREDEIVAELRSLAALPRAGTGDAPRRRG